MTLPDKFDFPSNATDSTNKLLIGDELALHGEVHFGAAQGCSHVLLLTLGTRSGSGLLLNGRSRTGTHARVWLFSDY